MFSNKHTWTQEVSVLSTLSSLQGFFAVESGLAVCYKPDREQRYTVGIKLP